MSPVSFKQFSAFIDESDGVQSPQQLDEIFGKIFGKSKQDQEEKAEVDDVKKNKVLTAKEVLQKKKDKEAARKKELEDKRNDAWMSAKERTERGRPSTARARNAMDRGGDGAFARVHEDKDSDYEEWQEGFKYAKWLRSKNKEATQDEVKKMSPSYARGFRKGLNESA